MTNVKTIYAIVGVLAVLLIGILLFSNNSKPEPIVVEEVTETEEPVVVAPATTSKSVIGKSVEGRDIETYTFGTGETNLLFVGGIHGGYEWNSILLAYEMADYLNSNPATIPHNITIHIIPNLNPDGFFKATGLEGKFTALQIPSTDIYTTGIGRFNANDIDLNRNFACKWAPTSSWRGQTVSAGTAAFSEPEAAALRDYVAVTKPRAAIFWHSRANNVYASECENGILPETLSLMQIYANAGDYGAVAKFDAYPITGDAEGWLASIGIPAVTVELESRDSIEWSRNLAGVEAVLGMYGK